MIAIRKNAFLSNLEYSERVESHVIKGAFLLPHPAEIDVM
jgi:hypothetical protein